MSDSANVPRRRLTGGGVVGVVVGVGVVDATEPTTAAVGPPPPTTRSSSSAVGTTIHTAADAEVLEDEFYERAAAAREAEERHRERGGLFGVVGGAHHSLHLFGDDDDASHGSSHAGGSIAASIASKTASTIADGIAHTLAHWKVLAFGQLLSFLLVGSGASSATLHFECNFTAAAFQSLFVYFGLSMHFVFLAGRYYCGNRANAKAKASLKSEADDADASDRPLTAGDDDEKEGEEEEEDDDDGAEGDVEEDPKSSGSLAPSGGGSGTCSRPASAGMDDDNIEDGPGVRVCPPEHTLLGLFPIHAPARAYFLIAFLDVQGNYLMYLSYRYTTFTSVQLFDSLAIPSAMVCSKVLLGRRYMAVHLVGAAVCMVGVILNVLSDYKSDLDEGTAGAQAYADPEADKYPNKVLGDLLAISGGFLYGLSDVLAEMAVKTYGGQNEFLGMIGVFGTIVSIVQVLILEWDDVTNFYNRDSSATSDADEEATEEPTCSQSYGNWLLFGYVATQYLSYVGTAKFLTWSEAALLNLSLLTSNLWAVVFTVFEEGIDPQPMFYVALSMIVSGVFVYEIGPSPISEGDVFRGAPSNVKLPSDAVGRVGPPSSSSGGGGGMGGGGMAEHGKEDDFAWGDDVDDMEMTSLPKDRRIT